MKEKRFSLQQIFSIKEMTFSVMDLKPFIKIEQGQKYLSSVQQEQNNCWRIVTRGNLCKIMKYEVFSDLFRKF